LVKLIERRRKGNGQEEGSEEEGRQEDDEEDREEDGEEDREEGDEEEVRRRQTKACSSGPSPAKAGNGGNP
jgi:hypothetical protein